MDLSDFIKSKNERFTLIYALYLILYFILVLGIDIDFILYYIITALIAVMLALITIIFQLEVIVDNFFFKFRKKVDMNIYEIIEKIWNKSLNNVTCKDECNYLKNTKCVYKFDINDNKVRLICMNRVFYPIINSDKDLNSSKSFVYQGFLNYYICIIILMISVLSPFFVNMTIVSKLNESLLNVGIKQLLTTGILLQIFCLILLFTFQIIRNLTELKNNKSSVIFKVFVILFLLLYNSVSIYYIILNLKMTSEFNQNSIVIYLVIITLSLIFSLIGRKSKRVKDYVLLNQELQLEKIIDLELNKGSVSKRVCKAICQDVARKEFLNLDS